MDHAYRQMKPAGLLMLLLTSLWGCSALPPGLSQVKIPGSVQEATKDFNEWMSKKFPGGQVRNVDRYCDAHEEPSYAVTDNVLGIMLYNTPQISDQQVRWYNRCPNRMPTRGKHGEAAKPLYG
jgi:hypothetical protein